MTYLNITSKKKGLISLLLILFSTFSLSAQISGTKTIGIDYASIADFITDLNGTTVGPGGVTLVVPSPYAETAPSGGFIITTTGTAADNITIIGTGASQPVITASNALTAGALNDGIFKIVGADYVNIVNLELIENAANTTTTSGTNNMTEWGIALLYASVTDGAKNCSLLNNTITLNRTYQNTFGIYANATHSTTAPTTSATATSPDGGNSGLKVYGNIISNVNIGIVVVGPTGAANHNDGIDIGGTSAATGNTLTNYGTTGTFSGYANVSGTVNGILVRNSKTINISYNTVSTSVGGVVAGTVRGIYIPSFSNAPSGTYANTISYNTISVQSGSTGGAILGIHYDGTSTTATSTLSINNNNFNTFGHTVAGATGIITMIQNASTLGTMNISSNFFSNINVNTTGTLYIINNNCSLQNFTINSNSILGSLTKTGAGGTVYGYYNFGSPSGGTASIYSNAFTSINLTGGTIFYGIRHYTTTTQIANVNSNNVSFISGGTSPVYGISVGYGASGSSISGNLITEVSSAGNVNAIQIGDGAGGSYNCYGNYISAISTTTGNVNGISHIAGIQTNIYKNKISNLTTNDAAGTVYGVSFSAGTNATIYNNLISDLKAPVGNTADAIRGMSFTSSSSSTIGVYYNTMYLNAISTGTNFGTSGIYHTSSATSSTGAIDLRNNIIINESVAMGTGSTVAFRRSGIELDNYSTTSNRNLFYAGISSPTNLIYSDGTNNYQTLASYQTAVGPTRDAFSITGEAFSYGTPGSFFISLTPNSSDYLRPLNGITTQVESGAANVGTITTDITDVIRAGNGGYTGTGTNPDMGAYEIEALTPSPTVLLNSVTPPATTQCVSSSRLISVEATTPSGTISGVVLNYSFNGTVQTPITMTNTAGSTWEGTIPAATPANASVSWSITATNSIGISTTFIGTGYADEPLFNYSATATASSTTVCSGNPTTLTASVSAPGTIQIGTATSLTGATAQPTAFCNRWSSYRMQTVYTAAELTSAGLIAGPISAITFNISTLGDGATNANYTVRVGNTALSTLTNFVSNAGFTTVFPAATYTHAVGLNTVTFSTPFNWDGTSNIVIEVSHDGANLTNNSQTYYTATAGNMVAWSTNGGATGTLSLNRLNLGITGITGPVITSVTWMDGATPIITGNPAIVNPTSTTTYSANITAQGCVYSPAPTVTVNVNPLPSALIASNSSQCGTQIPTASVTSTTGAITPTFNWYDAAAAGNLLQASTSTTFTSNVSSTTTFYVSEVDGVTGCESLRTAVTVTVSPTDGISASANPTTLCIGSSVTLTATNTNPTPNQNYTYSWISSAGSGAETSVSGASVIITPTQAGTYTYNLSGVDGLCNEIANVSITVDPFVATINPIDATCNGVANGSFSLGTTTCGTSPFTYSVDSGSFGTIPTNLAAGTYSVVVKDANGFTTSTISVTIGQPSTTISNPTVVNATVCQNDLSAMVSATSNTSVGIPGQLITSFGTALTSDGTGPNNYNVTVSALPANATIVSTTLLLTNAEAISPSYRSEIRVALSGATTLGATQISGLSSAGLISPDPNITIPNLPLNGGAVTLTFTETYNDGGTNIDATFGNVQIIINYTTPTPATITWWDAPTNGTQIGSGSPFETVGTSVLPNTATLGVYTVYAQGQNGACPSPGRTAATITVNSPSSSMLMITACDSYTLNAQTYSATGTYTQVIPNAAGCDSTITLMLTINNSSTSTTTVTECDSYTWTNGVTYNTSGTYTQTLVNTVGCDSIATLALTINYSNSGSETITACDSYTWSATGTTYTIGGMYSTTLTNQFGCDSSVMLMLTINNSNSGSQTTTACDSYTWSATGITYTSGGTYTATLTNQSGCDSTVTLMLTINNSSSSTLNVTECYEYTWTNGTTYNVSGTYTQTLTNAVGCDSIATLNLTINNSTTSSTSITACDSYTWTDGVEYTTSGTYSQILVNANGCDSIANLVLIINNSSTSATSITACDSYTWTDGFTYTSSGTYAQVLTNAAGCDSTATLNLTINNSSTSTTTVTECESYTWTDGNTYSASGTYSQLLVNADGCDSTATLVLTINGLPVSTATDNGDASITSSTGDSYEWIDCSTGNPIAGATAQTFTAIVNGSYAVVVTENGCSDTSDCVVIDYIGIKEIDADKIEIYPNPTNNLVTIDIPGISAEIEVIDAQGKILQVSKIENNGTISLGEYVTGVYILRISSKNGTSVHRIVKN